MKAILLALASLALASCGLNSADITYQRDGYDIHYTSHPDGTQEIYYTEISTKRVFRSVRLETGEWRLEVKDPITGLWVNYETSSKSPSISLGVISPEAAASINAD